MEQASRIKDVDIMKGFSLFGVLLVNINLFNSTLYYFGVPTGNIFYDSFLNLFVEQRFVSIFSLFFGIGIAMQIKKSSQYFLTRILFLGLIGVVNVSFFFSGDILLIYSLFGIVFYLQKKFSIRFLIFESIVVFFLSPYLYLIPLSANAMESFRINFSDFYNYQTFVNVLKNGTILEMMKARWFEYLYGNLTSIFWLRTSFSFILIGYCIGKANLHLNLTKYYKKIKSIAIIFVIYSLLFPIFKFYVDKNEVEFLGSTSLIAILFLLNIQVITTCFLYIIGVSYVVRFSLLKFFIDGLEKCGKTSLSNYMFQNVVCAFLFYGYGLKLITSLGPLDCFF